jgi:flagellar biosynthesis component FlhA
MGAPVVVAKGCNLLAQQIKREARWHGIPLVENPPLTQAMDPQAANRPINALQPSLVRRVLDDMKRLLGEPLEVPSPIVLCSSLTRFHVRRLLEPFLPRLVVLSPAEIPAAVSIQFLGGRAVSE